VGECIYLIYFLILFLGSVRR